MEAAMKKKKSLEESLKGHSAGVIEGERRIEVVGSEKLKELLEQYGEFLDKTSDENLGLYWTEIGVAEKYGPLLLKVQDLLKPKELKTFLQMTAAYEDHPAYTWNTGIFISRLILLDLHHSKRKKFDLHTENLKPINGLPTLLRSKHKSKLKVNIYGNVGDGFGGNSQYTIFDIHGDCGNFSGHKSEHCQYIFRGKVGGDISIGAENCTFTFLGQKKGEVFISESSSNNTYKFDDRDLACSILDEIDSTLSTVIYIRPNGRKEVIDEYS